MWLPAHDDDLHTWKEVIFGCAPWICITEWTNGGLSIASWLGRLMPYLCRRLIGYAGMFWELALMCMLYVITYIRVRARDRLAKIRCFILTIYRENKHVQYIHWSKKRKHAFNSRSFLTNQTNIFLAHPNPSSLALSQQSIQRLAQKAVSIARFFLEMPAFTSKILFREYQMSMTKGLITHSGDVKYIYICVYIYISM